MSVIVDDKSLGAFEFEDVTAPGLPDERQLLSTLDRHLRARAAELPLESFWAVVGNPAVAHLLEKMHGLEGVEHLAACREMLKAFEYVLTKCERRGRKMTRQ